MTRAVWVGCALLGFSVTACGGSDFLDADPDRDFRHRWSRRIGNDITGTGGSGGFGGRGGSFPPLTGGGGSVVVAAFFDAGFGGRSGGFPIDGGTFTEAVVESEDSPPPLAGGTLAIIGGGARAAVSDPDRDQVVAVDLNAMSIVSTAALARGDEPGRLVEDAGGRVHVVLRSGRAVAVIDPNNGTVLGRLSVCHHPRGLAYDARTRCDPRRMRGGRARELCSRDRRTASQAPPRTRSSRRRRRRRSAARQPIPRRRASRRRIERHRIGQVAPAEPPAQQSGSWRAADSGALGRGVAHGRVARWRGAHGLPADQGRQRADHAGRLRRRHVWRHHQHFRCAPARRRLRFYR